MRFSVAIISLYLFGILYSDICGAQDIFPSNDTIKLATIGNSISQGTDIFGIGIWPEYNWSSGTKINSHKMKLENLRGKPVETKNVSIVGAGADLLWLELFHLGKFIPDYTTIEIGANDVCRGILNSTVKHVKKTIEALLQKNPNMEIILAPIPKLSSMPKARNTKFCKAVWNVTCPYILGSLVTDKQRADRQKVIDKINSELFELASEYKQVYMNVSLGNMDITDADLAKSDCFHPSLSGQQKIADNTFKKYEY